LRHLGVEYPPLALDVYLALREATGNLSKPTWGGIVPAVIEVVSSLARCEVRVQHKSLWTPEYYLADAEGDRVEGQVSEVEFVRRTWLVINASFGEQVQRVTLEPAIYLLLNQAHAVFSSKVPEKGGPIMALQVYERE
jgi:hypothetical protein